ncbi:MAG TPA: HEAT repeat domain-containing protein, partial [Gemmataceae bacterium]|nr:HEAT repeat domain-containing protein [Gemmataceae bacterium]
SDPRKEARFVAAETMLVRNGGWQELKKTLKEHKEPVARLHAFWALVGPLRINSEEYLNTAMEDSVPEIRAEAAAQTGEFAVNLPIELQPPKKVKPPEGITSRVSLGMRIVGLAIGDPKPGVRLRAWEALAKMFSGEIYTGLELDDPFIANATIAFLAKSAYLEKRFDAVSSTKYRLGILLAQRRARFYLEIPKHLNDADPAVRRAAIQWVAEEGLRDYEPHVDKAATKAPVTREVFEAWLAAKELLANPDNIKDANKELGGDAFVLKIVNDAKQPAAFRAMALRMLPPNHGKLTVPGLVAFTKDSDKALQTEAVKTLAWRNNAQAQKALRELALDPKLASDLRRDAIVGLALSAPTDAETRKALVSLAKEPDFAADARRGLRGLPAPEGALKSLGPANTEELKEQNMLMLGLPEANVKLESPRPKNTAEWQKLLLALKGDPVAGERVFFHSKGPRCYSCHRIDGRGEAVGPDLSRIGAAQDRKKLIESILEPSKEIAPAFTTWLVTMRDGKQHTGVIALESFDSTVALVDAQGKRTVLKITDIEDRVAQKTSIMPADLHGMMTRQEFADLLAFLESRK